MRRLGVYCLLQCKRALRLLPHTLAVTALLALAAALAAGMFAARRASDASRQKAVVGVVADTDDPFLNAGLYALSHFDSSRDEISFQLVGSEPEALERLRSGSLSAYLRMPDGFLSDPLNAEPVRFITPDGASGLDTVLTAELASVIAGLLAETLNAECGAIRYAGDHAPDVNAYALDFTLADRYFAMVLDRDKLFRVESVGVSDALSFGGYYFCGLSVAFLLLWGTGASTFFSRRSAELGPVLRARGFGAGRQVAGEFSAFYLLMLLSTLCALAAAVFLLRRAQAEIPELAGLSAAALFCALARLVLLLGAMQFFLYELAGAGAGGILLQFLNAAVQGYAAGCFYPRSFFPAGLRQLGETLPAGVAMRSLGGVMNRQGGAGYAVLGYAAAFLLLSALLRRSREKRG